MSFYIASWAYRTNTYHVYNRCTRLVLEITNVTFDEKVTSGSLDISLLSQPSSSSEIKDTHFEDLFADMNDGAYDVLNLTKAIQVPFTDAEPETISILTEGWMIESSSTKTVEPETSAETVVQDLLLYNLNRFKRKLKIHIKSPLMNFFKNLTLSQFAMKNLYQVMNQRRLQLKTKTML